MRIEDKSYLDFDDVLIKPKRTALESRREIDLKRKFTFLHSKQTWEGIPIIASNMDTTGTFAMANEFLPYSLLTAIHKFYSLEEWEGFIREHESHLEEISDFIVPSIGLKEEGKLENFMNLFDKFNFQNKFLMLDVANGYTQRFIDFVKKIREAYPSLTLIAGNVATPEVTEALIFAGADIVKVGIGPSRVCDTRIKTGVGIPQLSAIIECADAAHGLGAHVMGDGGCKQPADIAKAFGAGADFLMLGSMLASHTESGGDLIRRTFLTNELREEKGEKTPVEKEEFFKEVYGMSSEYAMVKHYGKRDSYRASEGNYSLAPYKGAVKNTIEDILGGLRSTCTYVGAHRLKDLTKCTTFIRVNRIK